MSGPTRPEGLRESVVARLVAEVGEAHVLIDPELTAGFATDWTGRFRGSTPAVVRPGTTAEVAAVLSICDREGVAVVPQGGNTGLVGGGVPTNGEVVLSLARLDGLGSVDRDAAQVTAGAGVTLTSLQDRARGAGLAYGVDLASRDTATVGGTVATNAGGTHVLRWGDTRRQLVGIEVVLAGGRVVRHMGGLVKDNTGYDVAGLICGSEGTLGVVTAARLRLVPRFEHRVVSLVAVDGIAAAVEIVTRLRIAVPELDAAEVFLADGLGLVCASEGLTPPFGASWPAYVLVEASAHHDTTEALASAIDAWGGARDAAVASDERGRARLWAYRELHTSAINRLGVPHKLDVALPHGGLAAFAAEVPHRVHAVAPGARVWLFGHVGDGNLHVNVTGVEPGDPDLDGAVFELVAAMGGSISAEHGIGTAKKRWLALSRAPEEIAAFRAIKSALDPNGILNPNALLP